MGNRKLFILDEPTNGLDPAGMKEMRELIKSLPQLTEATVFISSHLLREIQLMADHVGIIHQGKLVFQGTMDELKALGKTGICLKVSPLEEAIIFLKAKGYEVERRERMLFLPHGDIKIEELNRELVMAGFDLSHLSEKNDDLEEIFLKLTGAQG